LSSIYLYLSFAVTPKPFGPAAALYDSVLGVILSRLSAAAKFFQFTFPGLKIYEFVILNIESFFGSLDPEPS